MTEKCKTCGGTGWVSYDLKSDSAHTKMIVMGIDMEIACPDCDAGKAELKKAQDEAAELDK